MEMAQTMIYRHLRELAEHFEPPAGFSGRFEIADGQVIMMMSPAKRHDLAAFRIARQLNRQIPEPLIASNIGDAESETLGSLRRPDVLVLPESSLDSEGDRVDPREILLAVEVVSRSNPENDYEAKTRDYPAMGIEHYLIVDPRNGNCVHLWEPIGDEYANRLHYKFGDRIPIGEWTVDTSELPLYGPEEQ